MIIRGPCVIIPGIQGMSNNIEAISILDRFLEHARVFIFCNGGENKYYGMSNGWQRIWINRIEVTCPILDPEKIRKK